MRRLSAKRLRTKLRLLFAGASVLLIIPVVAASLHLSRVMDLHRRLAQMEAAGSKPGGPASAPATPTITAMRHQLVGLGDRAFRDVITLASLSLVVLVALTLFAPGKLLQPLARLASLIRQAEGGNLRVVLGRTDSDEIGELTQRLHRMLQELDRFDHLKRVKIGALAAQRNQLLDLMGTPAALLDPEGRLLRASASFRRTFAVEEEALRELPLLPSMGWENTELVRLLAAEEDSSETELELSGMRCRVRVLRGRNGESGGHRLLLLIPGNRVS